MLKEIYHRVWNAACTYPLDMIKIENMDNLKFGSWTKVTVLTGAGISAESGIKTFRDADGLWENHSVEEVATPEAFAKNPKLVWEFYKQRFYNSLDAKPNAGHLALAELERKLGSNFNLITQNVDGLHRRAGNKNLVEMHGTLNQCLCLDCSGVFNMKDINLVAELPECPKCEGILRPDIVWFGEIPYHLDVIDKLISKCNIFMVIGTSGTVYPAAGFAMAAKYNGAKVIGINLEKPSNASYFDFFYEVKAGEVLPQLVKHWLEFFDIEATK